MPSKRLEQPTPQTPVVITKEPPCRAAPHEVWRTIGRLESDNATLSREVERLRENQEKGAAYRVALWIIGAVILWLLNLLAGPLVSALVASLGIGG